MIKSKSINFLMLAAAGVLAQTAFAQSASSPSGGLLGRDYFGLEGSYLNRDKSDIGFRSFDVRMNKNVMQGLDASLGYGYGNSENFSGSDLDRNTVDLGGRYFKEIGRGIKPFVDASAGWTWLDGPLGFDDDSFTWSGGGGVEYAVNDKFAVTPYARYREATSLQTAVSDSFRYDDDVFEYGIRANYWVRSGWAVTAGVQRDDNKSMRYSAGVVLGF